MRKMELLDAISKYPLTRQVNDLTEFRISHLTGDSRLDTIVMLLNHDIGSEVLEELIATTSTLVFCHVTRDIREKFSLVVTRMYKKNRITLEHALEIIKRGVGESQLDHQERYISFIAVVMESQAGVISPKDKEHLENFLSLNGVNQKNILLLIGTDEEIRESIINDYRWTGAIGGVLHISTNRGFNAFRVMITASNTRGVESYYLDTMCCLPFPLQGQTARQFTNLVSSTYGIPINELLQSLRNTWFHTGICKMYTEDV